MESSKKPVQCSTLRILRENIFTATVQPKMVPEMATINLFARQTLTVNQTQVYTAIYIYIYIYILNTKGNCQIPHIALGKYPLDHPRLIWWVSDKLPSTHRHKNLMAWLTKTTVGGWLTAVSVLQLPWRLGDLQCGNFIGRSFGRKRLHLLPLKRVFRSSSFGLEPIDIVHLHNAFKKFGACLDA